MPEHIEHSAVMTPDGNMISTVIQIGNCNTPATYQALMNYLFGNYIGHWMDIYLDDIVIYSNTLEEHVEHVTIVLDILKQERLYLSKGKLQFLCKEMKILGHIIDDAGIQMDSNKVDSVLNWKTPMNQDLLRGFIGSVGYLADDIYKVRVPMGVLSAITRDSVPFKWNKTQQCAFEVVKRYIHTCRDHQQVPLSYGTNSPHIWFMTDACFNRIAAVVTQGDKWQESKIAVFFSTKMNLAQ